MKNLYAVAYKAAQAPIRPQMHADEAVAAYFAALGGFPFDKDDDPSFFSARHFAGPVTWGVCRPDLRNRIVDGDWVVFFSFEHWARPSRYKFVAAMCVETKLTATDVHRRPPLENYLNLLVYPHESGRWFHRERLAKPWHANWLWRICDRSVAISEDAVGVIEERIVASALFHLSDLRAYDGQIVTLGKNYVVFDAEKSLTFEDAPFVADRQECCHSEVWRNDERSLAIRHLVFLDAERRHLRVNNPNGAHPYFRRDLVEGVAEFIQQVRLIMNVQ